MRIRKLVIYGFGQHEDVTVELENGINVFFGCNEAGKTTIQQFVLSILFGFPLRNQGLLRYEPKGGGRYGGQVHIDHLEFGRVIIERVKGKSAGDVTVFFADGTRGKDEALKKVLYLYDRSSYESIFSFSIHQLQSFEKMTEEELSRTLLASGTTGVDALTKLEQRTTKEMNALFKKSGRNPEMNVKIEEIRNLEQLLKEFRARIDQYEPSIKRISEINRELDELKFKENRLKQQSEEFSKYRQAKPLLIQKQQLEFQLKSIRQQSFPTEGIRRYESQKDRLQEISIQIEQLILAIKQAEKLSDASFAMERVKEMENILSQEAEWHHFQLRKQQLTNEIEQTLLNLDHHARLLGIKNESHMEQVSNMDVSLQREEYFQQVMQRLQHAEEAIRFERQNIDRIQTELQEVQRKLDYLQASAPSEAERQKAKDVQSLSRKVAEVKARQQIPNRSKTTQNTPILISGLILLVALIGAFVLENAWVAVGGGVLAALIYGILKNNNQPVQETSTNDVNEELNMLEKELGQAEIHAEKVRMYDERLTQYKEQQEEKLLVLKSIQINSRKVELDRDEARDELNTFLQKHGFEDLLQPQLFPELFKLIRQIQEYRQSLFHKSQEQHSIREHIQLRLLNIIELTSQSISENQAYDTLRSTYSDVKEILKEQQNARSKVKEMNVQLNEKQKLFEALSRDVQKLWKEAVVDTEADFYEADSAFRKKQLLEHELQTINVQLSSIGEVTLHDEEAEEQENRLDQIESQSDQIIMIRNELLEEKATLNQQTNSLLSDEQYGYTLQKFEQKKTELAELAHKWAVNKAVTEAIRQTMHNLKEKRLPFVLDTAQQFFKHLTNGRYESLEVDEEGVFEAVNLSGIRYHIAELSQATKEQAYISLRFALAESLVNSVPLPILMDDPFVHFDRFRTQQMVQLMTDLENQHQFFYFTCHEDMKTIWPHANVIDVATLRNERSVASTWQE